MHSENKQKLIDAFEKLKEILSDAGWELYKEKETRNLVIKFKRNEMDYPDPEHCLFQTAKRNRDSQEAIFIIWFEDGSVKYYKDKRGEMVTEKPEDENYQGAMLRADFIIKDKISSSKNFKFNDEKDMESIKKLIL